MRNTAAFARKYHKAPWPIGLGGPHLDIQVRPRKLARKVFEQNVAFNLVVVQGTWRG